MKRSAVVFSFAVACGASQPSPTPHPPSTTAAPSASATVAVVKVEPTTHDRIVSFAAARGGLHGEPAAMPFRTPKLKGAECWLFFVGGDAAHAAWLATPWDPAWGKASARLPDVDAEVQAPMLDNGVVFERVDKWPRAVRVTSSAQIADGVVVALETLAARDQPAGAAGAVVVQSERVSGEMPVASPMLDDRIGTPAVIVKDKAQDKAASATVKSAATSLGGLARVIAANGADVVEVWQRTFVRKIAHVAPNDVAALQHVAQALDAAKAADKSGCNSVGVCLTSEPNAASGLVLAPDGKSFKVGAIVIAPASASAREVAPAPASPVDALVALRMNETSSGVVRTLESVAVGSARILVAQDDRGAMVVERDGPFSRVTPLWYERFEKSAVEARIEDIDGDGVADVVLFARWSKKQAGDVYEAHSEAVIAFRKMSITSEPARDKLGVEIDLLGARDLDDAIKRAHAPFHGATATANEACAVLAASVTPSGLAKNAAAGAHIVSFDEPMEPAHAARIVPVARATAEDAAMLKDACTDPAEGGFQCRGGLCGNLGYGLGNVFRFVREGRVLKLETALLYTGS